MDFAILVDYYVTKDAVFYKLLNNLGLASVLKHKLNNGESVELALARSDNESHWLADWGARAPIKGFKPNCMSSFEIKSSTYYPNIKHKEMLYSVRNINITNLKIVTE